MTMVRLSLVALFLLASVSGLKVKGHRRLRYDGDPLQQRRTEYTGPSILVPGASTAQRAPDDDYARAEPDKKPAAINARAGSTSTGSFATGSSTKGSAAARSGDDSCAESRSGRNGFSKGASNRSGSGSNSRSYTRTGKGSGSDASSRTSRTGKGSGSSDANSRASRAVSKKCKDRSGIPSRQYPPGEVWAAKSSKAASNSGSRASRCARSSGESSSSSRSSGGSSRCLVRGSRRASKSEEDLCSEDDSKASRGGSDSGSDSSSGSGSSSDSSSDGSRTSSNNKPARDYPADPVNPGYYPVESAQEPYWPTSEEQVDSDSYESTTRCAGIANDASAENAPGNAQTTTFSITTGLESDAMDADALYDELRQYLQYNVAPKAAGCNGSGTPAMDLLHVKVGSPAASQKTSVCGNSNSASDKDRFLADEEEEASGSYCYPTFIPVAVTHQGQLSGRVISNIEQELIKGIEGADVDGIDGTKMTYVEAHSSTTTKSSALAADNGATARNAGWSVAIVLLLVIIVLGAIKLLMPNHRLCRQDRYCDFGGGGGKDDSTYCTDKDFVPPEKDLVGPEFDEYEDDLFQEEQLRLHLEGPHMERDLSLVDRLRGMRRVSTAQVEADCLERNCGF